MIYIKSLKFITYYIAVIIILYAINNFLYVGAIDDPSLFISIIPIVIMLYLFFNKKDSKIMNNINKITLTGMVLLFILAIPKYSYKEATEKILSTRFENELVTIVDIKHKDKKVKSMKRPSFFTEHFYRIEIVDSKQETLNFYFDPEAGDWVEK